MIEIVAGCVTGAVVAVALAALSRRRALPILRRARAGVSSAIDYRAPAAGDAPLVRWLDRVVVLEAELHRLGFVTVADLVMQPAGQGPIAIMRALVDDVSTTVAYLMCVVSTSEPITFLESYAADAEYQTLRSRARRGLALNPASHRQYVPLRTPMRNVVGKHRASIVSVDVVRVGDREALLRELYRSHERTIAWRAAQPENELLEQDLRGVLGPLYGSLGWWWARGLRPEMPTATARERRR